MNKLTLMALLAAAVILLALTGCEQEVEVPEEAQESAPAEAGGEVNANAEQHSTTGTVTAVDPATAIVTVDHQPVPSLEWPGMTMPFKVANPELLSDVEVGDSIRFSFTEGDQGGYVIQDLEEQR